MPSYTAITSTEIAAGKPVTNDVTTKIKQNFENHEQRLTDIENGTVIDYPPIVLRVGGAYSDYSSALRVGVLKTTVNFPLQVTGIRIIIDKAGTSGTTSVDILKSSGGGTYVSLLSTQPTVSYTTGNDAVSTDAVLDSTHTTLAAGDILRLDITSAQVAGSGFMVRIDFTKVG